MSKIKTNAVRPVNNFSGSIVKNTIGDGAFSTILNLVYKMVRNADCLVAIMRRVRECYGPTLHVTLLPLVFKRRDRHCDSFPRTSCAPNLSVLGNSSANSSPPEACNGVRGTNRFPKDHGDSNQLPVSLGMAVGIINFLEIV